jgi:hypothetical protein
MRPNLTSSFDERFIQAMDSAREGEPRGTWIERRIAVDAPFTKQPDGHRKTTIIIKGESQQATER